MTLLSRKTVRDGLVTHLKGVTVGAVHPLADEAGGQAHVFPYLTKEVGGISPFACVDGGSVLYDLDGDDGLLTPFGLVVGFWAMRGGDNDAAAEDMLDDLALALALALRANYNAQFTVPSVSDYETLDGIPYKFELHFVEVRE
jgi:hypothetical protein